MTRERFLELDNRLYSNQLTLEESMELVADYCSKKGKSSDWIAKFEGGLMSSGNLLLAQALHTIQEEYEREFNVTKIQVLNTQQILKVY